MFAIEIKDLTKSFKGLRAVDGLTMKVPVGSIYGFIGENGSGKSTTEKLICGHLVPDGGTIKLFGKDYRDAGVRAKVGALIENAGCFPNSSVYNNLKMQAINLGLKNSDEEINRVLKIVRMEKDAQIKFKNCSLGMKQRVGIAMALLGSPALLILDEPINGLDADGMRIMREILTDITATYGSTVLISSHVFGELEKIATHYGIIKQGKLIREISANEMKRTSKSYILVECDDNKKAIKFLSLKYDGAVSDDYGKLRVYGDEASSDIAEYLLSNGIRIKYLKKNKIRLEEYYLDVMSRKEKC